MVRNPILVIILLTGQAFLISGGDSGLGKAVAIAMAGEGADIAIIYLDEIESEDATIPATGGRVTI